MSNPKRASGVIPSGGAPSVVSPSATTSSSGNISKRGTIGGSSSTGKPTPPLKGKAAAAAAAAAAAQAQAEAEAAARAAEEAANAEQYYFEEVELSPDTDVVGVDSTEDAYPAVPLSPTQPEEYNDEEEQGEDYHAVLSGLKISNLKSDSSSSKDVTFPPISKSTSSPSKVLRASASTSSNLHSPSSSISPPAASLVQTAPPPTPADVWLQRKLKVWKMTKTLEMFQAEWADLQDANALPTAVQIGSVPHETLTSHAERNEAKLMELEKELSKTGSIANQAKESWEKLKRERDYHRMHHSRVIQEKEILIRDLKRLKKHYESFEPTLAAMKSKYEAAMKEKMMMRLERDRCKVRADALEAQIKAWEVAAGNVAESKDNSETGKKNENDKNATTKKVRSLTHPKDTPIPTADQVQADPFLHQTFEPTMAHQFQLRKTFKGHRQAISGMCLHPKKSLLCTVSDDHTWKMWSIPKGDLIMSGEGHKDWISSCEFHPKGNLLATSSGDATVKLWDFMKASCSYTFAEHTQAVWDVSFHSGGDFFVSGSMDHTSKLWDIQSQRCRQTFRGHVDSVNSVCFQPFSTNLCTASGDKTVSLWDMRSGLCVQTFYGHQNAVTHASFNIHGDTIISSDADGVVKLWDVRLVGEKANFRSLGNQAVNEARLDRSGLVAALASDDGTIKIFSTQDGKHLGDLEGHEDAVQSILFDPNGQFLISASSDQTFRIWS